ncbi:MAG: hypothetical protein RIK87_06990 [Fuerstiella sp.]
MLSATAIIVIVLWLLAFVAAMGFKRSPDALCVGMIGGYLFLPQFKAEFPGFELNKLRLISLTTAALVLLVSRRKRHDYRFSMVDLPMLGLPAAALAASIDNGLGLYDGFVVWLGYSVEWSLPWFVGRLVFATSENANILVRYTIMGGLAYIPFCVYEMKMAPTLHTIIFGYGARGGDSLRGIGMRFGLWRPNVFTQTGLELALFIGICSLLALWYNRTHGQRDFGAVSTGVAAGALGVTTVFCVSTGAIILTAIGWLTILASRLKIARVLILALAVLPVAYPVLRMTNPGQVVVEQETENSEFAARIASLRTRIVSEDRFLEHWKTQPLLGWTSRYYLDTAQEAIPDSLWIQILCKFGLAGWSCLTIGLLLPILQVYRGGLNAEDKNSSHAILAFCALLFLLDCMVNAMENPLYVVMAGAAAIAVRDHRLRNAPQDVAEVAPPRVPPRQLWPSSTRQLQTH